jgi:hypothetical protein
MFTKSIIKAVPVTLGLMLLGACASVPPTPEQVAEAKATKAVSDQLTQTKRVAKSEDGKMICKKTQATGSRFNKKVCATAEEWALRAEADRAATERIQRGGIGRGQGN